MTIISIATPPSTHIDDDSQLSQTSLFSPLKFRQAMVLARKMRDELRPHTKDRKWRFKSYANCFKGTHAISWALENINSDEEIAVNRLNQLVDYGLLTHVVDPSKRFRAGEMRTLYFRMAHDNILDAEIERGVDFSACLGKGIPLISGEFGSNINAVRGNSIDATLTNFDHILQQTVKELNDTRGKLEVMHQEVLGLVSQQISTFIMIFLLYIYIILFLVPWSGIGWFSALGLAVTLIVFSRYGWRCISLWSDLDSRTGPMETITVTEDGSSLAEGSFIRNVKTYDRKPNTSSITSIISKSIKSMTGVSGRTLRRLSSSREQTTVFMREAYSLPDVNTWKHRPLLICANTPVTPDLVPDYGVGPVPLGIPFHFSSELFEGTCLIRLKGSKSDDPEGDKEYFSGRKRIFQSVVQGRFKEEVPVSDVVTGHEFVRPLKNLPHPFILKTATNFIGKVSPGANIVVHTDQPFVEVTLGSSSQVVRGDEPGNEPNITCRDIIEDCSVFGGAFAKGNVAASRRKRLFSNPAKCKDYTFDTETVYTFEFYQNLFDAQSYSLDLGFAKIGCSKVLNGQPIQWLGKMKDGRYLWSFQIWHEKLLANDSEK
mmetsp:Transcript_30540/g.56415  ORF Transcript_30540/g.56415 Transcript_30540/m.56415 type:complete len:601 (+) Transcript_30540:96-1898(+)